ncbi:MAG: glycosyltransferase [Defluviitaleaceae bacterium]|nr:glycosyltransferase [Defluviitaleaceae bacterium]
MRPLISIIMAAYNAEDTIAESIESVLSQTYEFWELIIVNDGSTDGTAGIVSRYAEAEQRIRPFFGENKGVAYARNFAIEQAKGEYLAFLDSDDLWNAEKLSKQLKFMFETKATISYTATAYMYGEAPSSYVLSAVRELPYKKLLWRNLMSCSSVMLLSAKMIPFPSDFMHEDYAAWLQIVKKESFAYGLNEPLLTYRISKNSKSAKRLRSAKMLYNAYRHVGFSVFIALIFTFRYSFHSFAKRGALSSKIQVVPNHSLNQSVK